FPGERACAFPVRRTGSVAGGVRVARVAIAVLVLGDSTADQASGLLSPSHDALRTLRAPRRQACGRLEGPTAVTCCGDGKPQNFDANDFQPQNIDVQMGRILFPLLSRRGPAARSTLACF